MRSIFHKLLIFLTDFRRIDYMFADSYTIAGNRCSSSSIYNGCILTIGMHPCFTQPVWRASITLVTTLVFSFLLRLRL